MFHDSVAVIIIIIKNCIIIIIIVVVVSPTVGTRITLLTIFYQRVDRHSDVVMGKEVGCSDKNEKRYYILIINV